MFSLTEYREAKDRLPDFLPWALCVSDTTVLQKDGMLLRCWRFVGPDLSVASPAEQVAHAGRVNAALSRLGSGWGIWVELARHPTVDYPDATFSHVAAQILDIEARSVFAQTKAVHQSEYYLSLGWMSPTDRETSVGDIFYASEDDDEDGGDSGRDAEFAYFERVCDEIAGLLSNAFRELAPLRGDDLLTYLHSCVSTQRTRVAMPECPAYLDAYLPDEAFTAGEISLLGDQCLAMFTVRGFPKRTPFGMLDELCHQGIEFRWMTRFLPLDRSHAEALISRYQRRYWMSRKSLAKYGAELAAGEESALQNPIAKGKADEAEAALRWLGSGEIAFGYFTSTFVVWDPDPKEARRKAEVLKKIVQDRKLVAIDETMNGLQAWLGTIPGHAHANVRRPLLHTGNLVRMLPIMSTYAGQRENAHLKRLTGVGTPHAVCLSGSSRFDLSLAVGDVGHTLIVGPTGMGKTTLAGYLLLLWLKYPGAKVIIYDMGGGARAATLAVGGAYYTPGAAHGGCSFQPLRRIDDVAERSWAARWLVDMLALRGVAASHEVEQAVSSVLDSMATNPDPRARTLGQFVRLLGSHDQRLGAAMRIYTLDGQYGHIFDGDSDPLGAAFFRCYEMKPMMKLSHRPEVFVPVLQYLNHRDEELVDGSPIFKVKDECWRFWDDPAMAADSRADVKTGRIQNTYNVYLTQEPADFAADERLRSTMLTNTQTHIYLPNPKATTPTLAAHYAAFGLTPTEIQLIAKATPKKHYYYRSELGRRWFSLPVGPAAFAFIGGADEHDHRAMDAIVRDREPRDYALALLERQASKPGGKDAQWAVEAIKKLRGDLDAAA